MRARWAGSFLLLTVGNSRIRLLALKKAEQGDELIARLVELDGQPQPNVRISFAAPIAAAREVNGQEQPVGPATVSAGALVTSFTAYQPRTFAVKLAAAPTRVAPVRSAPVTLTYDLATASDDGTRAAGGFDGKGNALPAEMLPSHIAFGGVEFQLARPKPASPTRLWQRDRPSIFRRASINRVYVLAASADGDQTATFEVGAQRVVLNVEDWGGFIGQWDDRQWVAKDISIPGPPARTEHDDYARDDRHSAGLHQARGSGVVLRSIGTTPLARIMPYAYSYLFAYPIDLPDGAKSITLPNNDKIRILAISVADANPESYVRAAAVRYASTGAGRTIATEFNLEGKP